MYADADKRLKSILDADPVKKAEWEASFKLSDDPRITPFGRFLRKTSIDEFPQLFNVFTGDMALVGPRPIVEKEVAYYGESYGTFASVKPGITGLWQASGRSDTDYARRVALDIHYVLNWSPWMDIWILRRTVSAVLFMRGAC
jgi:lipopolysaccharide/colanic/teichoic acid biosynthesis glycosyltransferase